MSRSAPTSPHGLRERKKRATRRALQQAAINLFRTYGPESVTVEDICSRAEVSPRTFFNYFTAKEEVLVPWDADIIANASERILREPATREPLDVLHTVLHEALDVAMAGPSWRDQAILLRDHPELLPRVVAASRALEAALMDGLAERLQRTREDQYVRLASGVAMTALRTAIECQNHVDQNQTEPDGDAQQFLDEAFTLVRRGLRPDS